MKLPIPGKDPDPGEPYPSALAIGDSWFWYPHGNILQLLANHRSISDDHSAIRMIGFNGAELLEYVGTGRFAKWVKFYLRSGFREGFSEFYISGAGNDAVDYGLTLKQDCRPFHKPGECLDPAGLEAFLRRISTALDVLINQIREAYRDTDNRMQPIFIHGHDYPVPDGRGFDGGTGWLGPAMNRAQVTQDTELRKAVARILIDRLNDDVLAAHHSWEKRVIHIDSRETLSTSSNYRSDWENELHPTQNGFGKIVETRWLPLLHESGIATASGQASNRQVTPGST